jgi:hypothetical protein
VRALSVARLVFATGVAALASCSIWAALDNPYKNDPVGPDDGGAFAVDGPAEAGGREAAGGRRVLDAGFFPYAIAVHGDTVYAVDPQAAVHVAYDASTTFTGFWTGDGGDTFLLQTNGIAATASGVFWTESAGIRYCSADGGGCGLLPLGNAPRGVAASDPVVAWIDNTGVRMCATGLAGCAPASVAGSRGAASVAVGPGGVVAWTDGGKTVELTDGLGSTAVAVPYDVALVATDEVSGNLYWVAQAALGFMQFDGGGGGVVTLPSSTKPMELFARAGVAYWNLRGNSGYVLYCRFDSDAGCSPKELANGLTPGPTMSDGIVATSHDVLAIVSSNLTSALFVWRVPP